MHYQNTRLRERCLYQALQQKLGVKEVHCLSVTCTMAVPSALGLRVGVQTSDPLGRVAAPFALPTGRVAAPSHHVHIPAGAPGLSAAGPEHDLPRRASHSPTRQPLPVCAAAMVHTQEVAIPLERGSARMAMHAAACVTQLTSAPGACAASNRR